MADSIDQPNRFIAALTPKIAISVERLVGNPQPGLAYLYRELRARPGAQIAKAVVGDWLKPAQPVRSR